MQRLTPGNNGIASDSAGRTNSPTARADIGSATRGHWPWRGIRAFALAGAIVAGGLAGGSAYAAKKVPPIAEPMYLEAYANMVTKRSGKAIKPLTHLVAADPGLADIQNALALAMFVAQPDRHEIAFQHAETAIALAPDVPQFVVTYVLTNRKQWKIDADGTARLTRAAALRLNEAGNTLRKMAGNAKKLGKVLRSIEETGDDPDFPFVFADYDKFMKKPSLALTRPKSDEFSVAQKAIEEKVTALRNKLNEDKKVAQEESQKADARKAEIEKQVAEAAARQRKVEKAKTKALENLQVMAANAAESAKRVAELGYQRKLLAEVEDRRIAEERRVAEEIRVAEVQRLVEDEARLAVEEAYRVAERKAEEARIAEARRKADEARVAEEKRFAEEAARLAAEEALSEAERKVEEARIAEERRIAEAKRIAEEKRFAEEAARLAAEQAQQEAERKAEKARIAEERRIAEELRVAEETRRAEEDARRKAEEELRIVEERRKAIEAEDAARKAREELALIARAEEEARKEQEALELAQVLARQQAEEAEQKAREAEEAANATTQELMRLIAEQERLLEAALNVDTEPPVIQVVSAPETFELGEGTFQISGVVGDMAAAPRKLTINGEKVTLFKLGEGDAKIAEHNRSFRFDVTPDAEGAQTFLLEAVDAMDNRTTQEIVVEITVANRPSIEGKNYALIIGNNDYDYLPTLKTAVNDATVLAEVLIDRYAYDEGAVKLLTNATRREILGEMSRYRRTLTSEDRLIIYYAGHGQIDPATDEGFWQPVDAEPESDFTWISNADVKRYLGGMPAKHILIIADSCFSGSLTRGAETQNEEEDKFFRSIDKYPSRKVISSGGTEPVADAGSGGHSVFAYYLIKTLRDNTKPYITSYQLYDRLVRAVTNNSVQTPEFGTVRDSGDQGSGDFTFIRKNPEG